jgi:hypothetical protein
MLALELDRPVQSAPAADAVGDARWMIAPRQAAVHPQFTAVADVGRYVLLRRHS